MLRTLPHSEELMRLIRIAINVLRAGVLIELILGIVFWSQNPTTMSSGPLVTVHMFLGLLVVAALWTVGTVQAATKGGNYTLAWVAFILGLIIAIFGMVQRNLLIDPSVHWIIRVLHLLLGLSAAALGEIM